MPWRDTNIYKATADAGIVTTLGSAPVWSIHVAHYNELLSMVSLLLAILFGVVRLYRELFKKDKDK